MSENISNLIEIIKYIQKQQHILTTMLIHLGSRADLYDDFISGCFRELGKLKVPKFGEADK